MVWIALEPTVFDHRKTLALSIRLGLRETHLVGHLARLWTWALANAPTGELVACPGPEGSREGGIEPEVIARAADWTGDLLEIADATTFVGALVEVGFLDRLDVGLVLHGWRERHEEWAARREAEEQTAVDREEERKRKQRQWKAASRDRARSAVGQAGSDGDVRPVSADTPDRSAAGQVSVNGASPDVSGLSGGVSADGHVTVLARPDRTGPDRDRTSPDRTGRPVTPLPPSRGDVGGADIRAAQRVANGRGHGLGETQAAAMASQWLRWPPAEGERPAWDDWVASQGRPDLIGRAPPEKLVATVDAARGIGRARGGEG